MKSIDDFVTTKYSIVLFQLKQQKEKAAAATAGAAVVQEAGDIVSTSVGSTATTGKGY